MKDLRTFVYLCAYTGRTSAYSSSFVALAFRNALYDCTDDGHMNSSDDLSISVINLVSFCPVTPELMRLNCRRRSSFGLFYLRSLRDNSAMPGGLHARLCHASLVVRWDIRLLQASTVFVYFSRTLVGGRTGRRQSDWTHIRRICRRRVQWQDFSQSVTARRSRRVLVPLLRNYSSLN